MEPIQYTFRNTDLTEYNDVVLHDNTFDLENNEYTFLIKPTPSTKFWRFGFVFSTVEQFEFVPNNGRYSNQELKFIEIDVGDKQSEKWRLPNLIALGSYHIDGFEGRPKIQTNYVEGMPIEIKIKFDSNKNVLVSYSSTPVSDSEHFPISDFRFFRIFAWADNINFEIDCNISSNSLKELFELLIEENIKTHSTKLDLSKSGLKVIPNKICELSWLKELILGSDEYFDFKKGEKVKTANDGSDNLISNLPDDIAKLTELEKLIIAGSKNNKLKLFNTDIIGGLTNLTYLFIEHTSLRDVTFLSNLSRLEHLSLYDNSILKLSDLSKQTNLMSLVLSYNPISSILNLSALRELTYLSFRNTRVNDLSPISKLKKIKYLHFSYSLVQDISVLSELKNLEKLSFSGTLVNDITPLSTLKKLELLYFLDCRVKSARPLILIKRLKVFECRGNPIQDCPTDVVESSDPRQLRAYFNAESLQETENQRKDVKLIILGNSDCGKTNLSDYLQSGVFSGKRNSTHGLEVHSWTPQVERFPSLKNITVSIWDFGGQEYYHDTYRLFLSSNALYLLMWCNSSNNNSYKKTLLKEGDAEVSIQNFDLYYWLDTIKYYSEYRQNSTLLVTQNKADNLDTDKIRISQEIHDAYFINNSFCISLREGSDKNNTRQYNNLVSFFSELEYAIKMKADAASIPRHWQKIRDTIVDEIILEERDKLFSINDNSLWLDLRNFVEICNAIISQKLTEEEVYTIPRWLAVNGIIVYFPDVHELKEKIFIRPDLLASRIYEVLSTKVLGLNGEFAFEDVFAERNEINSVILNLALQLELIFDHPIKGKGHYIAPQYLPENHPIEDLFQIASKDAWKSAIWIKLPLFFYKKALQALLLTYAGDIQTERKYFWKHGIMFIKNGLRVLIKGLYPNEHERDGTLMMAVEKDALKQEPLEREIFNNVQKALKLKDFHPSPTEQATHNLTPNDQIKEASRGLPKIELSYDSKNFIEYQDLLLNIGEFKIKTAYSSVPFITQNFSSFLPTSPPRTKRVFLSYSHQNTNWLGRLRTHLSGLRHSKQIETWDDKEIFPGDLWDDKIRDTINQADIFILLLSADFIASNYIWNTELTFIIENYKHRNAKIIPVLFEPLDLGGIPNIIQENDEKSFSISSFEILPKDKDEQLKAVSLWQNQEEALSNIAKRIRETIQVPNK